MDDGTGIIRCSWWRGQNDDNEIQPAVSLGNLVTVLWSIVRVQEPARNYDQHNQYLCNGTREFNRLRNQKN